MSSSIVLITGANTGLGFEIVKALCQSPTQYTIVIGGRSLDKANAAVEAAQREFPSSSSVLSSVQVDIEDDESISKAFDEISQRYQRLDVLINNAGALFDVEQAKGTMSIREMWNKTWNVNTTGTYVMTHTFVPLLLKSSNPRLLFIASGTSNLTDSEDQALAVNKPPQKGWPKQQMAVPAYRSSKTGMNMMMREWSRMLREDGVKVWAVSPGFLATGLGGDQEANKRMGALDPTIGGKLVREVVEGGRDEFVGKVVRKDGVQPW